VSVEGTGEGGVRPGIRSGLTGRSAGETWRTARQVLNAKWQLRRCSKVGRLARVRGHLAVYNDHGEIVLGERVRIYSTHARTVLAVFPGGRIEVGDGTFLNYGVDIAATRLVRIGADCLLGAHVGILDNDFHDLAERWRQPQPKPVVIGDRVWLGNRVMVLPGVTIGDDAVVGAASVVVNSIPPRSLAVGNPARVIRTL
jgi:acetyltransferase-like isoleucine patch superfamily enzyme